MGTVQLQQNGAAVYRARGRGKTRPSVLIKYLLAYWPSYRGTALNLGTCPPNPDKPQSKHNIVAFVGVANAFSSALSVVHGKNIHIQGHMAHCQRGDRGLEFSSNCYRNRTEDSDCVIPMADLKNGSVWVGSTASKSLLPRMIKPKLGSEQIHVWNAMMLDDGTDRFN